MTVILSINIDTWSCLRLIWLRIECHAISSSDKSQTRSLVMKIKVFLDYLRSPNTIVSANYRPKAHTPSSDRWMANSKAQIVWSTNSGLRIAIDRAKSWSRQECLHCYRRPEVMSVSVIKRSNRPPIFQQNHQKPCQSCEMILETKGAKSNVSSFMASPSTSRRVVWSVLGAVACQKSK